ncbi:MAG: hypothetical protein GY906_16795, partial [bacterium]|nr:hypothetical protein [bacterium]
PFPLGVRLAHRFDRSLVSWAWAVNGAASVAAPALAMILAINWGFSLTFILGGVAYVVAAVGLLGFRETSLHFSPIS